MRGRDWKKSVRQLEGGCGCGREGGGVGQKCQQREWRLKTRPRHRHIWLVASYDVPLSTPSFPFLSLLCSPFPPNPLSAIFTNQEELPGNYYYFCWNLPGLTGVAVNCGKHEAKCLESIYSVMAHSGCARTHSGPHRHLHNWQTWLQAKEIRVEEWVTVWCVCV